MVAGVLIDAGEHFLRALISILRDQRLDEQPRSGGGLNVGHSHLTGIDGIGQILQAGGHGQALGLHELGVDNDGALLRGDGSGVVGHFLQGVHIKGQGQEHLVLILGALEVEGAHGDQIGLQIFALRHQLSAQLGGAKGLDDVLVLIAIGIQGVGHRGDGLIVGVGVEDHLLLLGCGVAAAGIAARACAAGGAAAQKGCRHAEGKAHGHQFLEMHFGFSPLF